MCPGTTVSAKDDERVPELTARGGVSTRSGSGGGLSGLELLEERIDAGALPLEEAIVQVARVGRRFHPLEVGDRRARL